MFAVLFDFFGFKEHISHIFVDVKELKIFCELAGVETIKFDSH